MPYATYLNEDDRRNEQIKLHYKPYLRSLEKKALDFHTELKKEYDGKKWDNQLAGVFDIHSIPANLLVDKEGIVRSVNLRGQAVLDEAKALLRHKAK